MKEISLTGSLLFLYICYIILKDLFASSTVKEGSFGNQKTTLQCGAYSGTQLPQRDTAALFRHTMRKRGYTCCLTTCQRRKAEATKKTAGIVTTEYL